MGPPGDWEKLAAGANYQPAGAWAQNSRGRIGRSRRWPPLAFRGTGAARLPLASLLLARLPPARLLLARLLQSRSLGGS